MTRVKVKRCLLNNLLNKKGWSQLDLSIKTGLSTTQISEYVSGKRGMSLNNAKLIAHVLKCNIDELYEWIIKM